MRIRVASRKSALAMTQTNWVIEQLKKMEPGYEFEIIPIVTKGDKILDVALSKVGGKGLFVSEIEASLLSGEADIAVHSMKDVPSELAEGLVIGGIPQREDPRDALISKHGQTLSTLPRGAVVGTSSLRRVAQIRKARPDLVVLPLRGNIDTRLGKLTTEGLDAIILAAAGLHRMGWQSKITEYLDTDVCLPAIGQGVLGIECRDGDSVILDLLHRFTDERTALAATAERALLSSLNGGCQVPLGGYAGVDDEGVVQLTGFVGSVDGSRMIRVTKAATKPEEVGVTVAEALRSEGADEILQVALSTQG